MINLKYKPLSINKAKPEIAVFVTNESVRLNCPNLFYFRQINSRLYEVKTSDNHYMELTESNLIKLFNNFHYIIIGTNDYNVQDKGLVKILAKAKVKHFTIDGVYQCINTIISIIQNNYISDLIVDSLLEDVLKCKFIDDYNNIEGDYFFILSGPDAPIKHAFNLAKDIRKLGFSATIDIEPLFEANVKLIGVHTSRVKPTNVAKENSAQFMINKPIPIFLLDIENEEEADANIFTSH